MSPNSFKIIINAGSGHDEKDDALSLITSTLEQAGRSLEVFKIEESKDLPRIAEEAVIKAKADNSVVIAAGGDGSVNMIAGFCHDHHVPMGIIPLGTFNFFARDHKIPTDIKDAAELLLSGSLRPVPIAKINNQIFLVHAGIGLYSEIIRNREKDKREFGRYRIVALLSSFRSLMRTRQIHTISLQTEKETIKRRTLNIFVGNNTLQLENLGLAAPGEVRPDELAIVILKPVTPWQRLRLAFWGLIGQMNMDSRIERFIANDFTIDAGRKTITAAVDGEFLSFSSPIRIASIPKGLDLIVPLETVSS
jgi:YegS/Rv2252/BmrU family lipid kinase